VKSFPEFNGRAVSPKRVQKESTVIKIHCATRCTVNKWVSISVDEHFWQDYLLP